jgi:hypothetical protein
VVPVVPHAVLDLIDRVIHQRDGLLAMAAFIGFGALEIVFRGTQMIECRLHVRLVRKDLSGDEPNCKSEDENKGG